MVSKHVSKIPPPNTKEYYEYWTDNGLDIQAIADLEGVTKGCISKRFKKFGVLPSTMKQNAVSEVQNQFPKSKKKSTFVKTAKPKVVNFEEESFQSEFPSPEIPQYDLDPNTKKIIDIIGYGRQNNVEISPNVALNLLEKSDMLEILQKDIITQDDLIESIKANVDTYLSEINITKDISEFLI